MDRKKKNKEFNTKMTQYFLELSELFETHEIQGASFTVAYVDKDNDSNQVGMALVGDINKVCAAFTAGIQNIMDELEPEDPNINLN